MTFDPAVLPHPVALSTLRDNTRVQQPRRLEQADWYTPMLLFGVVGSMLGVGRVGVIPIIYDCMPVAWTLSSNVAGNLVLRLTYADYADNPSYTTLSIAHPPMLSSTRRNRYREVPFISGWQQFLHREGEIEVWVDSASLVEQCELVLYTQKV